MPPPVYLSLWLSVCHGSIPVPFIDFVNKCGNVLVLPDVCRGQVCTAQVVTLRQRHLKAPTSAAHFAIYGHDRLFDVD